MAKESVIWNKTLKALKAVTRGMGVVVGFTTGFVVALLIWVVIGLGIVVCVPSVRTAVLDKGVALANEYTDWDIELGRLYLSPFHHSPLVLYHAYKGESDLPIRVEIDSAYVGHRGKDTLAYVGQLRLKGCVHTAGVEEPVKHILTVPMEVERLLLDHAAFHSDSLIKTVGVDAEVGRLDVVSPQIVIKDGMYPLHGLQLRDVEVYIDLRSKPEEDTVKTEPKPLKLAFELPDGELRNVRFGLYPLGLGIGVGSLSTEATINVGINRYEARRLNVGDFALEIGSLYLPIDTIYGNGLADINNQMITSSGLHARSDAFGAKADVEAAAMSLERMRVEAIADAEFMGSKAHADAWYAINEEAYDATVHVERVDLSPFLKDSRRIVIAGDVKASGRGVNPKNKMVTQVHVDLDEAIYEQFDFSRTKIDFATDSTTSLSVVAPSMDVNVASRLPLFGLVDCIMPMVKGVTDTSVIHGIVQMRDLTMVDTIRHLLPPVDIDIALREGSPLQFILDTIGMDIRDVTVTLRSDTPRTDLYVDASIPYIEHPGDSSALRLPPAQAALRLGMTEGRTDLSLQAGTHITDGVMSLYGLCTDAALRLDVLREDDRLSGDGRLTVDSLSFGTMELGSRAIDIALRPSDEYDKALRVDVKTEDIPLDIVDGIVKLPEDIALRGAVRAHASIDGLPRKTDISAEVYPLGVGAEYKPLEVGLGLGKTPIVMRHNHVDLNGLPVYGADSTFIALTGGLDLDSMRLDVTLASDSFAPVKLVKDGPIPVYGDVATAIYTRVTGPLDSIDIAADVTLLPCTDITYPIDKKNLARVKPYGTVNVHYGTADGDLALGGRVHVDEGLVRFSPKIYPVMPFRVDSGSYIAFNGPIGQTLLNVSASQAVKADVESEGEDTRRVDFRTGVRVNGTVDSIGLHSIDFFLEAPEDEAVTRELASVDDDTREGLAAALLATGMYAGESNAAAKREGYALSSIINSRINAAMANSKVGKFMDVDISTGQSNHAKGSSNDLNIALSKSFFHDKLRVSIGSTISDDPDVNKTNGLLSNISAAYTLTKDRSIQLKLYSKRDYNNVFEGDLFKSGLAVTATKEWKKKYGLSADAGVAYRSNNSIGPDVTLKSTIKNIFGKGETFTLKGNGAYYWALRARHPGDPKKSDTYKLGVNATLLFPYLHWAGTDNPAGDTRYMLGYQYENIAGGYGVHKLTGSFTYFIHSSPYITHAFTPFSLSVVLMKAESDDLMNKAEEYPSLIEVLVSDEFVPSVGYNFIYNDYRARRSVNTLLDLGVKESGNLINALYCAFGYGWNEKEKPLGKITFNQFVKLSAELHNKFNITDQVCIATRLFAGANIPLGNSYFSPLSEAFYAGGPNSLRASSPYAYGPGNFYSAKYNQNFFHAGDVKLEANFELRFPIVWKLYGAAFVDAGNVWNWYSTVDLLKAAGFGDYLTRLEIPEDLYDGIIDNPHFAKQIALGTGAGVRLDLDGLVIRLDIGVGIHAPYQTFRYDKEGNPDKSQPIHTYFNIPSALDAIRFNFGIGYPF